MLYCTCNEGLDRQIESEMAGAAQAGLKDALRAVLADPNSVHDEHIVWAPGALSCTPTPFHSALPLLQNNELNPITCDTSMRLELELDYFKSALGRAPT